MIARAGLMFDNFDRCESPIEALLQLAMAACSSWRTVQWCSAQNLDGLSECAIKRGWPAILIASQVNIPTARARADFVMAQARPGSMSGVALHAIECDGAAFHVEPEDVSDDMQRDQALANLGVPTTRLKGSWIVHRPIDSLNHCVEKVRGMAIPERVKLTELHRFSVLDEPWDSKKLSKLARTLTQLSGLQSTRRDDTAEAA